MRASILVAAVGFAAAQFELESPALNEHIIKAVNSQKGSTWVAGHNDKFAGMTVAQAARLMGTLREGPHAVRAAMKADAYPVLPVNLKALPTDFNSSTNWPQCANLISGARDQSDCGSCWAFGSTEAFSDRLCITYNVTSMRSAQDTASCCSGAACPGSGGCNGGYPLEAWEFFKAKGVVTGGLYQDTTTCYPYELAPCSHHEDGKYPRCPSQEDPTPACKKTCIPGYATPFAGDEKKAKTAYNVPANVAQIQAEIQARGPVTAAFTVYQDFLTYKSGVYQHTTGQALGGHAVKIIGWGVDGTTPYWTVMNSWNQYWGDWGAFKILRGADECGIEDQISAGTV